MNMRLMLLTIVAIGLFSSCGQDNSYYEILKDKKWGYDEQAMRESVKGQPISQREEYAMNSRLAAWRNVYLMFMEEGRLVISSPERDLEGTWSISNDGKFINLVTVGKSKPLGLIKLSEDQIIIAADPENGFAFQRILIPIEGTD